MDNEDEGARLTRREENRELIAKHRAEVEMLAESIVEMATVDTPRTDAAEVTMLRLDGDADVVVAAFFARTLERELIDLKQRLLPQYMGRAERAQRERQMAEHERDAMHEKLIAATNLALEVAAQVADEMTRDVSGGSNVGKAIRNLKESK